MTDQPAVEPPSMPKTLVCSVCGQGGLTSIGNGPKYDHDYTKCIAAERDRLVKDRDSWKMLADSTNARCDRLVAVNERLVVALGKAILWTDEEHDVDNWRPLASAALAWAARKP